MKILLISFYNDMAYGLRQLHAVLYHAGYNVRILFFKLGQDRLEHHQSLTEIEQQLLYKSIQEFNPDCLGFSLTSPNFGLYKRLYPKIRTLGDFKILLGGWQASLNPEETLRYCDFLCVGEGEDAIAELVQHLSRHERVDSIKNIWVHPDIRNAPRPLKTDLDALPIPVFDQGISYIESNCLVQKDPYTENQRYGTMLGRGCPYACSYCSNSYMRKIYPSWSRRRHRSIGHLIAELHQVRKMLPLVERINFYDEVFLPRKSLLEEFCTEYRTKIGLPFYCLYYPGTCSDEMAKKLKEAGLAGVWLGIQSGSERVRREIFKRHYTNADIKRQVAIFKKYDITVKYDFIFDNPFETPEETEETVQLMKDLPKPLMINFFSLKFFPSTEITTRALEAGIITHHDIEDQLDTDCPDIEISAERQKELLMLAGSL